MREYGTLACGYWTHPDVRSVGRVARELGAYLITGPHSNGIGCYWLPDGYVQADLGYSPEEVAEAFVELARIELARRCEASGYVRVARFLRWNPVANANVGRARAKEWAAIPSNFSQFKELAHDLLRFGNHWDKDFEALLQTVAQTVPQTVHPTVPQTVGGSRAGARAPGTPPHPTPPEHTPARAPARGAPVDNSAPPSAQQGDGAGAPGNGTRPTANGKTKAPPKRGNAPKWSAYADDRVVAAARLLEVSTRGRRNEELYPLLAEAFKASAPEKRRLVWGVLEHGSAAA